VSDTIRGCEIQLDFLTKLMEKFEVGSKQYISIRRRHYYIRKKLAKLQGTTHVLLKHSTSKRRS
jgi:hypothetical protein